MQEAVAKKTARVESIVQANDTFKDAQDHLRIRALIDHAISKCNPPTGGRLAEMLDVSPQVLSNWKTGQKTPSLEAQCDIAAISGSSVAATALSSLIEAATGNRKKRFQQAYKTFVQQPVETAKRDLYNWAERVQSLFSVRFKHRAKDR